MPSTTYTTWELRTSDKNRIHACSSFRNAESESQYVALCKPRGLGTAIKIDRITVTATDGSTAASLEFNFPGEAGDFAGVMPFYLGALAADERLVIEPKNVICPENTAPRMNVLSGEQYAVVLEATIVKVA